jgi:hypothetical protein
LVSLEVKMAALPLISYESGHPVARLAQFLTGDELFREIGWVDPDKGFDRIDQEAASYEILYASDNPEADQGEIGAYAVHSAVILNFYDRNGGYYSHFWPHNRLSLLYPDQDGSRALRRDEFNVEEDGLYPLVTGELAADKQRLQVLLMNPRHGGLQDALRARLDIRAVPAAASILTAYGIEVDSKYDWSLSPELQWQAS